MTNLVNVEDELINAVVNQVNSSGFTDDILQEVGYLIDTENNLDNEMAVLSQEGLANDAVFQQDLADLVGIQQSLTQLIQQAAAGY